MELNIIKDIRISMINNKSLQKESLKWKEEVADHKNPNLLSMILMITWVKAIKMVYSNLRKCLEFPISVLESSASKSNSRTSWQLLKKKFRTKIASQALKRKSLGT